MYKFLSIMFALFGFIFTFSNDLQHWIPACYLMLVSLFFFLCHLGDKMDDISKKIDGRHEQTYIKIRDLLNNK